MTANSPPRARVDFGVLVTEVALVLATFATLLSFERLFSDDSWRRPVFTAALLGYLTAMALRRIRIPAALAVLAQLVTGVAVVGMVTYRSTTNFGLPTRATIDIARSDLDAAGSAFPDAIAPTEALPGFVLLTVAAVWLLVMLADWGAFRSRSVLQALAPLLAILVFIAALGGTDRRYELTALALGAAMLFAIAHRSLVQLEGFTWLGSRSSARAAVARGAAPVAILAGLTALLLVPAVPDAEQAIVDIDDGGQGDPTRVVISPLVDIRSRLIDQQDVEVFQVRSEQRSYWRLTSLDTFDGTVWSSRADYGSASGGLDLAVDSGTSTETITQSYRIEALAAVWLPAAYQPRRIDEIQGAAVSWEPGSGTLIVDTPRNDSDGIDYIIESAVPRFDQAQLAALPAGYPADFEQFTALPTDFSAAVADKARDITANASTPYGKALLLQDFFRSGFTYSTDISSGHGAEDIDEFLFRTQTGYCEQFAGSFAAMARSLGLPARVAVGFTPGDNDLSDPTLYRVRGEHAHAWPEVYIQSAGWVAFEPTPGRGAPGADYTGVPEQQDESGPRDIDPNAATSAIPPLEDILGREFNTDPLRIPEGFEGSATGAASSDDPAIPWQVAVSVFAAVAVLVGLLALVPVARDRRRARALADLGDPARIRVLSAWSGLTDALAPLGVIRSPTETTTEFADRIPASVGSRETTTRLAESVTVATYSATPPSADATLATELDVKVLSGRARRQTSWWKRARTLHDPRTIFGYRD